MTRWSPHRFYLTHGKIQENCKNILPIIVISVEYVFCNKWSVTPFMTNWSLYILPDQWGASEKMQKRTASGAVRTRPPTFVLSNTTYDNMVFVCMLPDP